MKSLREIIHQATETKIAIGHFNISNLEGLWGIFRAAQTLNLPVIIGVSEGERDFIGVQQAVAVVRSIREEYQYPIFLNADHTYSFERVREAVDAGFDAVIFDGAKLPVAENIHITKQCVDYARSKNQNIIVEGELGYIGTSSKILSGVPEDIKLGSSDLTTPEAAAEFVRQTGSDLFAPAVGNIHGMLKDRPDPNLDIDRISKIKTAAGVPLVLHGASGNSDDDVRAAIKAGVAIVHVNTELRVAYRDAVKLSLQENPDEVAPYKILKPAVSAIQRVVEKKLKVFNGAI